MKPKLSGVKTEKRREGKRRTTITITINTKITQAHAQAQIPAQICKK